MKAAAVATLSLIALAAAAPALAQETSLSALLKNTAFIGGIDACEDAWTGAALGLKGSATGPGPFGERGFEKHPVGDEAKVGMLLNGQSQVFRATPASQGQVFVALASYGNTCRVGAFNMPGAGEAALLHLQRPGSPWTPMPIQGPEPPGVTMRMFEKSVAGWKIVASLSFPRDGEGPEGLTGLVTVAVTDVPPPSERK